MKFFLLSVFIFLSLFSMSHADDAMVWVEEGKRIDTWPACVDVDRNIPDTNIYRISFQPGSGCPDVLMQVEGVVFVEQSKSVFIPDMLISQTSGNAHTCDIGLENSDVLTDLGSGKDIVVAVIDTGVSFTVYFSSLKKNINEIPGDGIDNDLNGYIDDYDGWDFGDMDSDPADVLGHGTQVTSILLSVAPQASILPIKVNSGMDISFSTGDAAEAIYYAASRGADVLNLSFSTDDFSFAIYSAVISAVNSGCVVIAAAGNDGANVNFPASMDEVIAVGSHDVLGAPSGFSPIGDAMDILGPGEDVCATNIDGMDTIVTGTSFSAPVITGAVAVLLSMNPNLTPGSIKKILFKGTNDILDPGWDIFSGYGNIDSIVLASVSTPSINLPDQVLQGSQLDVGFTLPPTDTLTDVFFALIFKNVIWWLDSSGFWHKASETPFSPLMTFKPDTFITKNLYGQSGLYDSIDTTPHEPGNYLWGIGIFDKNGNMLAPLIWKEMNIYY
jgi:subtilisin family serine protease